MSGTWPVRLAEQALAAAQHDREDEQVQPVEQAVPQQPADQGGAAAHADVVARLLLQLADLGGDVTR